MRDSAFCEILFIKHQTSAGWRKIDKDCCVKKIYNSFHGILKKKGKNKQNGRTLIITEINILRNEIEFAQRGSLKKPITKCSSQYPH